MNPLNLLYQAGQKIVGGYKADRRMNSPEFQQMREEQSNLSEWGDPNDPNQKFTGKYGKDGKEIWSGGNVASFGLTSESVKRGGQGDMPYTEEEAAQLGVAPERLGAKEFDPYANWSGGVKDNGVGVDAMNGGIIGENSYRQVMRGGNKRGDTQHTMNSGDTSGKNNQYYSETLNPYGQGQVTMSQQGSGKKGKLYYDDDNVTMTSGKKFGFLPWGNYEEKS
tara:strand:+ start:194 stop:859 length:666 start_codon:yes stop_codon:yes gene_type:complete